MFCKNCGSEIKDFSKFCWNCGHEIKIEEIKPPEEEIEEKKLLCRNCGSEVNIDAEICPQCGGILKIVNVKDPGVASVLSFIVPGLGLIYNGDTIAGMTIFILEALLLASGSVLIRFGRKEGAILLILMTIIWMYIVSYTYKSAEKSNKKLYS